MGYIKLSKFMATKNYPVFRQFQEAVSVTSELKISSLSNAESEACRLLEIFYIYRPSLFT